MAQRLIYNGLPVPLFVIPKEKNFDVIKKKYTFTTAYATRHENDGYHFEYNYVVRRITSYHWKYATYYTFEKAFKITSFTIAMWYYHHSNSWLRIDFINPTSNFIKISPSNDGRIR